MAHVRESAAAAKITGRAGGETRPGRAPKHERRLVDASTRHVWVAPAITEVAFEIAGRA